MSTTGIDKFIAKLDQFQIRLLEEGRLGDARLVTDAANMIEDLEKALEKARRKLAVKAEGEREEARDGQS